MHEYAFDVTILAAIRIHAETEEAARKRLAAILDCVTANFGYDPETGHPVFGEASLDTEGEPELYEVDGMDPEEFSAGQAAA